MENAPENKPTQIEAKQRSATEKNRSAQDEENEEKEGEEQEIVVSTMNRRSRNRMGQKDKLNWITELQR